jgi:hypothetical protein
VVEKGNHSCHNTPRKSDPPRKWELRDLRGEWVTVRGLDDAGRRSDQLPNTRVEPPGGLEPPAVPYEGTARPDELQRHRSGSWGRTNIARFRAWNPSIERSRIKVRKVRFERTGREV